MSTNLLATKPEDARLEMAAATRFKDVIVNDDGVDYIAAAKKTIPEVLEKVLDRIGEKALRIRTLDKLGVDLLVEINGIRFAIDVTTGTRGNVKSKKSKMEERQAFFKEIGAVPTILRSGKGFLHEDVIQQVVDCYERMGDDEIVLDIRVDPRTLEVIDVDSKVRIQKEREEGRKNG